MTDPWSTLADKEYDLVVVGCGIFGACAAWEAASRGLTTVLLERGDFGEAASANSYKFVHGGIRYLARLNLTQLRASSRERSTLLRIAPHLVVPRSVMMPTYGIGAQGKTALRAGFAAYDLLTTGRNRGITDPSRRIPPAHFLTRSETLAEFPALPAAGLTGAAVFADAQVYSTPRLTLGFVHSASASGVAALNYAEVAGFLGDRSRVRGVVVTDRRSGGRHAIRSRMVLNAAGAWAAGLLQRGLGIDLGAHAPLFSRDVAFVTPRRVSERMGLACPTSGRDANAVVDRGGRHLFFVPWRDYTLVGVWHGVHRATADEVRVPLEELAALVEDANRAYAGLNLRPDDVSLVNAGLVLFGSAGNARETHDFGKRSLLIDHRNAHGLDGLVTLVGFRATVARSTAVAALEPIAARLGRGGARRPTESIAIHGGDVADFEALVGEIGERLPARARAASRPLAHNHGSRYRDVLACAEDDSSLAALLPGTRVLGAEVAHAARHEWARTLADVVLRRTDLGTAADPGAPALLACATILERELGWSRSRRDAEIAAVTQFFRHRGADRTFGLTTPATHE
ncbi:MAG TPA: FAD-dependent oxidoreductase [Gemmatimonadales bacterium]|nr:FAD-dependent oxidoreductase [Gemmatimonadales bacterium]